MPAQPRYHTPRSDRPTRGPAAAKIAAAKGRPWMPWQRRAADVALEIDPATGLYWYGIVVVTVPRQAGKTKLEGDIADHRCLTTPRGRVWYTAQTGKDASAWMRDEHFESLEDAASIFGRPGTVNCRYRLSRRAGSEGVGWHSTRATFRAFPPKRDGLHGKQSDLVFVDEAWAFTAEQGAAVRQAVRATMNTRPGAQLWIVSTEGDDASTYLDGYLDLGRESLNVANTRVAIVDYGISDDTDPEDIDAICAAHPAYGYTTTRAAIADALDDFRSDPAAGINGFARAYGNRRTRTRGTAIPPGLWTTAGRGRSEIPTRAGLAFDVTPSGTRAAIAAAWRDPESLWGELLYAGPAGRDGLPPLLAQLARARRVPIGYDPASLATLDVIDALARHYRDVKTVPFTTAQYGSACLTVDRAIRDGTFRHSNQPDLTAAAQVVVTRPLGDGGIGWGRKGSAGSICEMVAVTLAARMFDTLPRPRLESIILAP